jgi:hypothetical protein
MCNQFRHQASRGPSRCDCHRLIERSAMSASTRTRGEWRHTIHKDILTMTAAGTARMSRLAQSSSSRSQHPPFTNAPNSCAVSAPTLSQTVKTNVIHARTLRAPPTDRADGSRRSCRSTRAESLQSVVMRASRGVCALAVTRSAHARGANGHRDCVNYPQGKARPTSSWPRPRSFEGRKTATVLRLATRFGQLQLLAGR